MSEMAASGRVQLASGPQKWVDMKYCDHFMGVDCRGRILDGKEQVKGRPEEALAE